MSRRAHAGVLLSGCALWLAASVALAEPAPPTPASAQAAPSDSTAVSGIVVEGRSQKAMKSFSAAVNRFVQDQGRPSPVHGLARWDQQICPGTVGLTQGFDAFVSKRIKEIAARVGAPGEGTCKQTNLLIIFTTQPDKLMADIRDHHPGLLGYHNYSETKSLAAFRPPMKSWYITATDGRLDGGDGHEPRCIDLIGCAGRILPPMHVRFAFALVVVDSSRIEGKPIGAVAAEIAMTALSMPAADDGCRTLPSIMDVLNSGCPSSASLDGLTTFDEAYLKALYAYNTAPAGTRAARYAAQTTEIMDFERKAIVESILKGANPPLPDDAAPQPETAATPASPP
jgi:hypothetical protein